ADRAVPPVRITRLDATERPLAERAAIVDRDVVVVRIVRRDLFDRAEVPAAQLDREEQRRTVAHALRDALQREVRRPAAARSGQLAEGDVPAERADRGAQHGFEAAHVTAP